MSQRGGDVQSNLRLGDEPVSSDLIPHGEADLIISMEPMEALRYVPFLRKDGRIVSSSVPFINIPNYPDVNALIDELKALPNVELLDIDAIAKENKIFGSANMILLGMAAPFIGLIPVAELRKAIGSIFAAKGSSIVESNYKAFDIGLAAVKHI